MMMMYMCVCVFVRACVRACVGEAHKYTHWQEHPKCPPMRPTAYFAHRCVKWQCERTQLSYWLLPLA